MIGAVKKREDSQHVFAVVEQVADTVVGWNANSIINAIKEVQSYNVQAKGDQP